ncbi:MAG: hypothetical protein M3Z46_06800, partial [Actinomycetota bacterium]|nr:hypothetical protein [Actinomycetota bacterium]
HDRAEAALGDVDELDLRDLRSVVVAADTAARDDVARDLAFQLRAALARRVDEEQSAWLTEVAATLADDRVVRALRLSSRPPKAGSPFPPDLATRLASATSAALTADTATDRWATVLDALSFAPVRLVVTPRSVPDKPSDELVAAIRRVADRLPQIAALFGLQAEPVAKRRGGRSRRSPGTPRPRREGPQDQSGLPVPPPPSLDQVFGAVATVASDATALRSSDAIPTTIGDASPASHPPLAAETGSADDAGLPDAHDHAEATSTTASVADGSLATAPAEAAETSSADDAESTDAHDHAEATSTTASVGDGSLASAPAEAAEASSADDAGLTDAHDHVEATSVTASVGNGGLASDPAEAAEATSADDTSVPGAVDENEPTSATES